MARKLDTDAQLEELRRHNPAAAALWERENGRTARDDEVTSGLAAQLARANERLPEDEAGETDDRAVSKSLQVFAELRKGESTPHDVRETARKFERSMQLAELRKSNPKGAAEWERAHAAELAGTAA